MKGLSEKNPDDLDAALTACIVYGTLEEASAHLESDYGMRVSVAKLEVHLRKERERYTELREWLAPQLEKEQAHNLLSDARKIGHVKRMALDRTAELLQRGQIKEPSIAVRNLADAEAKAIDKHALMSGKPTARVESTKDELAAIIDRLVKLGVAEREPHDPGYVEAEVVEDSAAELTAGA